MSKEQLQDLCGLVLCLPAMWLIWSAAALVAP